MLVAVLLASCQDMSNNPKQTGGTLLGAGLGALAGSQIGSGKGQMAAIAIGALAGGLAGGSIGRSLDDADRMYANRNAQQSFETTRTGATSTWRNPDSGNSGTITPTRTYQTARGANCREYESTIYVEGKSETSKGTACRQPDGSWKITQ